MSVAGKVGSDALGIYLSEYGKISDRIAGFVSHKLRLLKHCAISLSVGDVSLFKTNVLSIHIAVV